METLSFRRLSGCTADSCYAKRAAGGFGARCFGAENYRPHAGRVFRRRIQIFPVMGDGESANTDSKGAVGILLTNLPYR